MVSYKFLEIGKLIIASFEILGSDIIIGFSTEFTMIKPTKTIAMCEKIKKNNYFFYINIFKK